MKYNKKFDAKKMLALNGYNTEKSYLINLVNRAYDKIRHDKKALYLGAGIISLLALIGYGNCHRNENKIIKTTLAEKTIENKVKDVNLNPLKSSIENMLDESKTLKQKNHFVKGDNYKDKVIDSYLLQKLGIEYDQSPYFSEGGNSNPNTIVLHGTAGRGAGARDWFKNSDNEEKTSAHMLVGDASCGYKVLQFVNENDRAHHIKKKNTNKLGIEVAKRKGEPIKLEQGKKAAFITAYWMYKYQIPFENVRGHHEISPTSDPIQFDGDLERIRSLLPRKIPTLVELNQMYDRLFPNDIKVEEVDALITFYDSCKKCCGKYAGGPTTIGDDPNILDGVSGAREGFPLGTKVDISEFGIYEIDDYGSGMSKSFNKGWKEQGKKGNIHFDVRVDDHEKARKLGRQIKKVRVYIHQNRG